MNINIAISIENEIIRHGFAKIISDGILTSRVFFIDKNLIEESIKSQKFNVVVIDDIDVIQYSKLIVKLSNEYPKIKFFLLSSKKFSPNRIELLENNSITILSNEYSFNEIVSNVKNSIFFEKKMRTTEKIKNKLLKTDPIKLLSNRELEIALLLVKGYSTTEISKANNISMSTVSTYKNRIFQKTKAKNLVQISGLFNVK